MKVPKKLDLAVRLIKTLGVEQPKRVQDVAPAIGTTVNFLEQIARRLRVAGIIQSVRGPGGGYVVVNRKVTLYDVSRALQYTDEEMSGLDGQVILLLKGWIVRNGPES